MIDTDVLAVNTAEELCYSTRFMGHYIGGVVAKLANRPFLYDNESGRLTDAGARFVRHQILTRHTDGTLRQYEASWIESDTPRA